MPITIAYPFLLEMALKSTLLLGLAWLVTLLLRRKSAALRHLVWNVAFAAVLLLPVLSVALPALRVPVAATTLSAGSLFRVNVTGAHDQAVGKEPPSGQRTPVAHSGAPINWGLIVIAVWAAGAAFSFAQMVIALATMERIRRRARPFEYSSFRPMAALVGMKAPVTLLATEAGSMPFTYGLLRPGVFLPADADRWDAGRLRVVLLHELAHVRRGDAAAHLLAKAVVSLYWWNPVVRAAWHEFLKERERAADDLVLNLGTGASTYAEHLVEIASSMGSAEAFGWAAVPMARRSQLEGRVSAILDPGRNRQAPPLGSLIAASLVAILLMAPLAAVQARRETAQTGALNSANVNPAAALIKEGDAARNLQKWDQARAAYEKALGVLGSGPETAPVLIHLGTTELGAKNYDQAITDFERARAADSSKTSEAQMWMAITQKHQNHLDAAEALYQSALAAAEPRSAAAATILELQAQCLDQQDRADESKALLKEAAGFRAAQAAQVSATLPSSSDVYKVGGDVHPPSLSSKVEPNSSEDARIAQYSGTAVLAIEIGVDGVARNIKVVRGLGFGLDQKAIEAIGQWKFNPGTKDGQPVNVMANVEVNFRLL